MLSMDWQAPPRIVGRAGRCWDGPGWAGRQRVRASRDQGVKKSDPRGQGQETRTEECVVFPAHPPPPPPISLFLPTLHYFPRGMWPVRGAQCVPVGRCAEAGVCLLPTISWDGADYDIIIRAISMRAGPEEVQTVRRAAERHDRTIGCIPPAWYTPGARPALSSHVI